MIEPAKVKWRFEDTVMVVAVVVTLLTIAFIFWGQLTAARDSPGRGGGEVSSPSAEMQMP